MRHASADHLPSQPDAQATSWSGRIGTFGAGWLRIRILARHNEVDDVGNDAQGDDRYDALCSSDWVVGWVGLGGSEGCQIS